MNILFKNETTGEIMYRCPGCGIESDFSTPNSLNRYDCDNCRLILEYPHTSFLEVLVWHWKKRHGMFRPYPIRIDKISGLKTITIFAFAMMFEPEDVFGVFSYVSMRNITCLQVNHSFLICYR